MKLRHFLDHGANCALILPEPSNCRSLDTEAQACVLVVTNRSYAVLLVKQAIAPGCTGVPRRPMLS